jgi:hypothetical protein
VAALAAVEPGPISKLSYQSSTIANQNFPPLLLASGTSGAPLLQRRRESAGMLAALLLLLLVGGAAGGKPGVNITWGEFTDAACTKPLGVPAPALAALDSCAVVTIHLQSAVACDLWDHFWQIGL